MKNIRIATIVMALGLLFTPPSLAAVGDVMVPASMQRCTSNQDCTMVSNHCSNSCATLPVNRQNISAIDTIKAQRCAGAPAAPENEVCHTNPPMEAACVNNRCTVGYAYKYHGDAQDYKPGAFPVPEQPAAPAADTQSFNSVNDRDGHFTAYDMPQDTVRQNIMGQYRAQNPADQPSPTETSIQ